MLKPFFGKKKKNVKNDEKRRETVFCFVYLVKFAHYININVLTAVFAGKVRSVILDVLHDSKVQLCYNEYRETRNYKLHFGCRNFIVEGTEPQAFLAQVCII